MKRVNMNETVQVVLTNSGREMLNAYDRMWREREHEIEADGSVKMQLWELMYIFGHNYTAPGSPIVFKNNEITIP